MAYKLHKNYMNRGTHAVVCEFCGYTEEHFPAQAAAKEGQPCDRCRR